MLLQNRRLGMARRTTRSSVADPCIRIQNFKSLRDATVDLSPVTVFIGKSGTGKTNFASAIQFLGDYPSGDQGILAARRDP